MTIFVYSTWNYRSWFQGSIALNPQVGGDRAYILKYLRGRGDRGGIGPTDSHFIKNYASKFSPKVDRTTHRIYLNCLS
ncbi:hypothetical protein [Microcoleus sp. PH2017_30_WIL_O_A]|uniref:hypothetical protein n=1 Tax=Microcoleus sp. PH2017_30_WIL_O_A TaxID=2798840 RepID=UPI001DFB2CFF|nr:hypothetical protein [Microcoleus sp. PH2017_30_WIL_O_A]MCC3588963.1 hypothetical protein [Microcoleus sp. PH2017_30_WIL_O_A]